MDPTLAAILSELYRLSAENEALKQKLRDLEREREKTSPVPKKESG